MLVELTIRDFAVIDELTVTWSDGLNALTGETGAGKSIIVDAVGALLGDRLGPDVVRAGRVRAVVEGVFQSPDDALGAQGVREVLAEYDLLEDDQLIIRREIARGARGTSRINGRAVPLSLLQQVGERLIDVHGQAQHLSLLRVREHLDLLDRYAALTDQRREVATLYQAWRAVQARKRTLQEELRQVVRERDLLRHEVAEIEAAGLRPDEESELVAQRQRLRYSARLRASIEQTLVHLQGLDEQLGAIDLLANAGVACGDAARADESLAPQADVLNRLSADAEEVSRDLRLYVEQLESGPRQLDEIEARFLSIADLKRKYGETVPDILAYEQRARARLATAERGEELLTQLADEEQRLKSNLGDVARDLSRRRREVATTLAATVERELKDLNLQQARFEISVRQQPDQAGVAWICNDGTTQQVAVDATGADRVEFLFSANPGQPPQELARIASGGELARVALALKAVLASVDHRVTLIFDEIDVGVGGRSASVVGQKLWELTASHQVLCVTHMPQVAAFADLHLVVSKSVAHESTSTIVQPVQADGRISELSAMLGGHPGSSAAEANARDLVARAEAWKSRHTPVVPGA